MDVDRPQPCAPDPSSLVSVGMLAGALLAVVGAAFMIWGSLLALPYP